MGFVPVVETNLLKPLFVAQKSELQLQGHEIYSNHPWALPIKLAQEFLTDSNF